MMQLLVMLGAGVAINLAMFVVAFKRQTDSLTDVSYAATFTVLALAALLFNNADTVKMVAVLMVCAWALRLGGFLLYRIRKTGRDHRFDEMRGNFKKFLQFWLLQGVSVWVILLPVLLLAQRDETQLTLLSIAGIAVWLAGLLTEGFADFQKFRFTNHPANKGAWIDQGLWKYSRHPNYFGEICVWAGMYMFAISSLAGWQLIAGLASPLFIISLLLFVSGIPKLEKGADERWGNDQKYRDYKRRTSILIPLPKKPK